MINKTDNSSGLLLIDGHSIASRAFYGLPPLTNSEGLHTNAIYGFLNIFFNAWSGFEPDNVIVAFDARAKTFRHDMFPDYKGTRKGMPEELLEQIPVLKEVLKSMNIRTCELPGFEADDVLGTYAREGEKRGFNVVVLSGDRDLLQLASDKIMVALPRTKGGSTEVEHYYAADVKEKYGVTPTEFIDMKALMGDTSDNIPGIPGIGEKTAANIIIQFGSLENAFEHAGEIKPPRAQKNLVEYIEQGRLSRELARINTQAPVPFDINESGIESESVFYNNDSYELFKRLELNRLLSRFEIRPEEQSIDSDYVLHDGIELEAYIDKLLNEPLSPLGFYIDCDRTLAAFTRKSDDGETVTDVFTGNELDVKKLLSSGKELYTYGLKAILHSIFDVPFSSEGLYDIELMAYLLDPLAPSYTYDKVMKDYCDILVPSKEELTGKLSVKDALSDEGKRDAATLMAACSSKSAFLVSGKIASKLKDAGMHKLFMELEMPLLYSLFNMELAGVKVDEKKLSDFSALLDETITALEKEIYAEAGEEFNINSPKQLGSILFEKLKLPHGKKTKTGYSTSADVLEKLAPDFPFVNKILEYRQAAKLKSTYADGLVNFISPDGRIHGTFNQTVTATGRISSTEPNLQNIPIRNELGQEIRKAFVAKEGCVFIDADYSQIELRLLAHLSADENLIEAYKSDADVHKITASKVFNTPLEEVTAQQRRNAKAVNFGIVYGISSFGLSRDLSISRKEAAEYIRQYFETYPKVKEYLDKTVSSAKQNGYTVTMFDRRRPIPELSSSNFMQRAFGERAAMNSPIQGSAADIMKIAMINVEKALADSAYDATIVLQVHDELLVECAQKDAEAVSQIVHDEMKAAAELSVPLEVEVNTGKDWYEAH